jgi:hypothetical protein
MKSVVPPKKAEISNTDRTSSQQDQNCDQTYRQGNRWDGVREKPAWYHILMRNTHKKNTPIV